MSGGPLTSMNKCISGDGLFDGDNSQSSVQMNSGSRIDLAPTHSCCSPSLRPNAPGSPRRKFSLAFSGSVKVAIHSQVTEFKGENSELQIYIQKNEKPLVRLMKGKVSAKQNSSPSPIALPTDQFITLTTVSPIPASLPVTAPPASVPSAAPAASHQIEPAQARYCLSPRCEFNKQKTRHLRN